MWWDLNSGTVMQTIKSHLAAITTLVYDETSNRVYASGVDPYVVAFSRIENEDKWVQSVTLKKIPSEVTSAVLLKSLKEKSNYILIGQKSPMMKLWRGFGEIAAEVLAFPKHFNCSVLGDEKLIAVPKSGEFCICRLESSEEATASEEGTGSADVDMENDPKENIHYAGPPSGDASFREVFGVKLPDFHSLCNVAMSKDTKWLCYSSQKSSKFFLRLFQVNQDFSLTQVPLKGRFSTPIVALNFSSFCDALSVVFTDGLFQKYDLVEGGAPFCTKLYSEPSSKINILQVLFHKKSPVMAVVKDDRNVGIFTSEDLKLIHELPKRTALPVSLCFSTSANKNVGCSEDRNCLSVLYSDYHVFEYNLSRDSFNKWCSYDQNDFEQCGKFYPSIGSSLQYVGLNDQLCKLIFHTIKSLHSLDWEAKRQTLKVGTPKKRSTAGGKGRKSAIGSPWLKTAEGFSYVRNLSVINETEMILFLCTQQQLLSSCESVFNRKTFAT